MEENWDALLQCPLCEELEAYCRFHAPAGAAAA